MKRYIVKNKQDGMRIDKFVCEVFSDISRTFFSKNLQDFVLVNSKKVKPSHRVKVGDQVEVNLEILNKKYQYEITRADLESKIVPQVGPLDIIYEQKDYLVLNKPSGLAVHPGIGHEKNTLANYVKKYLMDNDSYDVGLKRAGIVHRLDMPVGGLIVFAKNRKFQKYLAEQFENHNVLKVYFAHYCVMGKKKIFNDFKKNNSVYSLIEQYEKGLDLDLTNWIEVSGSMKRDPSNRKRMLFQHNLIDEKLRFAQSYLLPLSESKMCVLIKTGRMHQIRATLRSLGIVLTGDKLYGWKKSCTEKIGLNSVVLGFADTTGKRKVFNILKSFDV